MTAPPIATRTIALILLLSGLGCTSGRSSDQLWVPDGAVVDLKRQVSFWDGAATVSFTLVVSDSREDFTKRLRQHVERQDWKPRSTEWRNPHLPTSFRRGWIRSGGVLPTDANGKRLPVPEVYLWTGEWENADGDVISYNLISVDSSLHVYGAYSPATMVRGVRQQFEYHK
jgi:hypothetical protein